MIENISLVTIWQDEFDTFGEFKVRLFSPTLDA